MTNFKPVVRNAEHKARCRACDAELEKGTQMVSWYSFRNRGQYIHICLPCAKHIGYIAKEHKDEIK